MLASPKFLQSAGSQPAARDKSSAYVTHVRELEAKVQTKEQDAAALQDKIVDLEQKVAESEAVRDKQHEEIEALKKHAEDTDAILRHFFMVNR